MEELEIIKGETKLEDRLNEMGILKVAKLGKSVFTCAVLQFPP